METGGDGFDVDDEYGRFRRRQRIHRMHLVGYVVSAALVLIGMLLFWTDLTTRTGLPPHLYKCGGNAAAVL